MRLLTVESCGPLAQQLAHHEALGTVLVMLQAFAGVRTSVAAISRCSLIRMRAAAAV